MSQVCLNSPPPSSSSSSPIPSFLELKRDHQYDNSSLNDHDQVLSGSHDQLSCQIDDKNPTYYSDGSCLAIEFSSHAQDDLKVENALSHEKPNDVGQVLSSSWPQNNGGDNGIFTSGCNPMSNHRDQLRDKIGIGVINNNVDHKNSNKKWKPSKVRITQKVMATSKHIHMGDDRRNELHHNLEQGQHNLYNNNDNNNNNNNGEVRVCSNCHTTTTPLWRSGPQGPKSLCNACGIRQRKARKAAMAITTTTEFGTYNEGVATIAPTKSPKHKSHEEMRARGLDYHESHPLPLKKRGKITCTIDGDKCGFSSSNKKGYVTSKYYSKNRALPRDEEEGAILLMALSHGLPCSS